MSDNFRILDPFRSEEAISIPDASKYWGVPERTLRRWRSKFGLGIRIGGYERQYALSRVAVAICIAQDWKALAGLSSRYTI